MAEECNPDLNLPGSFNLDGVTFGYGTIPILKNFTFTMEPNSIVVILGPSGCGKTTFLHRLAHGRRVSMMFQEPRLLPWYTVEQNLSFVLGHLDPESRSNKISRVLESVNLSTKRHSFPDQLSGGQRQRVSMARAFVYSSEGLLLDEPFQGLDVGLRYELLALISQMWKDNPQPIVAVSHDPREAAILGQDIRIFSGPPFVETNRFKGHPDGIGIQDLKTLEIEQGIIQCLV